MMASERGRGDVPLETERSAAPAPTAQNDARCPVLGPSHEDVVQRAKAERAAVVAAVLARFATWMKSKLPPLSRAFDPADGSTPERMEKFHGGAKRHL
jgi:hypothetical protein